MKSLEGSGQLEREPGREKGYTKGQNRADRQGLGVVFHHQQQQSFVYFWGRPRDQRWEVQFSRSVVTDSLWPHESQHTKPPCPSPNLGIHPNPCPLSRWCHPTISSSVIPSPLTFNLSQHQGLFKWVSSLHQVAKVLEFQLQHQSYQWTPRTDLL